MPAVQDSCTSVPLVSIIGWARHPQAPSSVRALSMSLERIQTLNYHFSSTYTWSNCQLAYYRCCGLYTWRNVLAALAWLLHSRRAGAYTLGGAAPPRDCVIREHRGAHVRRVTVPALALTALARCRLLARTLARLLALVPVHLFVHCINTCFYTCELTDLTGRRAGA